MFNINNNELSYGRGYVYSLQYHLVWCTKYRKKVLKDGIDAECKEMLCDLAEEYKFQILAMEVMPDHIHLLVIVALIGQSGHFCEYAAADIVYRAVYTSHVFPPVSGSSRILLRHR